MISILSLLLVGVAVGFFRLYRQRRELAQQLQSQNEELAQKNEELNQLDKTKTRFFSNISHELKTPLTLIINPIRQFLKKANLSNQDFYLLKSAETNSIQLFDLTNQILELTKFDVQKVDVNETAFNFHQLLSKTHADFESLAVAKKIDFQLDFQGSQDLTIFSDSYKIYTILKNLISNAIKFSSEDDTILIKSIEHENELTINISDTGQGIHESDLPNIFDRYYQAKISKKFVGGGTGIGLSLSQEYAKLLGGSISAKSEYLKGSQFTLVLPKKVAQKTITANTFLKEKQTPQLVIPTKNTDNNTANTQPTILLVEDNLSMQSYLKLILSDNFNVIIANHGKEALAILEERVTDIQLIISDIMMPVMNGHELLSALKANPTYAAIPIVMLTALSDTDDKLKALRVGIDDYLVKPFVDEELLARIDNLISNSEQRKAYRQSLISETTEEPTTEQATNSVQELSQKDTDFLKSLEEVVLLNYHNTNFDVSSLALSLRLSRAQVYRRIKSATGLTPKQYIDQVRFQESKKLLEKNQHYTIKAIALSVGFKDEKNFARNFKKRFGKNPSEYLM